MSALAARRAAALAASASSPSISANPSTKPAPAASVNQDNVLDDAQSEPASEPSDEEMEEQQPVAGPSKRRRHAKEHSPRAKQRYFAAESESADEDVPPPPAKKTPARTPGRQTPASNRRKQRARFSPSAPAELSDSDGEPHGSGDDGSSDEDGAEGVSLATPLDWTNPSTPRARSPRISAPSRPSMRRSTQSVFVPRVGVNVFELSEEQLAGLDGVPGSGNAALVCLKPHEALMVAGVFTVVPLRGQLSLFSNVVHPTDPSVAYPVFAPTSHPLPVISPTPPGESRAASGTAWNAVLGLTKAIGRLVEQHDLTLFLLREHQTGIEGMRAGAVPGFTNVWLDEFSVWGLKGVHPVVGSFASPVYPHHTPEAWSAALSQLLPASSTSDDDEGPADDWRGAGGDGDSASVVALVKGPKRSGKSTLARAALNTLLQGYAKVAWLETDLGQGEFAPGGVVGLWIIEEPVFGPAFTHARPAARAHFLGAYSPLSCPDEYIAAIQDLVQHYRFEVQYPLDSDIDSEDGSAAPFGMRRTDAIPLVVNTQGWVKGLGEELLAAIEGMADPTHIFAFDALSFVPGSDGEGFDTSVPAWERSPPPQIASLPGSSARLSVLPPAPASALQTRHNAADFRTLALLAYMYSLPSSPPASQCWDFSRPLADVPPVLATLGEEIKDVYLIGEGAEGVVPDDLHLALNGSIVALLARQDGDDRMPTRFANGVHPAAYIQGRSAPSLDDTTFVGYALIRAVRSLSTSQLQLQLITPLSPEQLSRVSVIVKNGAIELPTAGLVDWRAASDGGRTREDGMLNGGEAGERPFFEAWHGGVGAGKRRIRRNIQRR